MVAKVDLALAVTQDDDFRERPTDEPELELPAGPDPEVDESAVEPPRPVNWNLLP